jgi:hypothetical protein
VLEHRDVPEDRTGTDPAHDPRLGSCPPIHLDLAGVDEKHRRRVALFDQLGPRARCQHLAHSLDQVEVGSVEKDVVAPPECPGEPVEMPLFGPANG